MEILNKNCKGCGKNFVKVPANSTKYWLRKAFCSSACAGLYNLPAKKLIGRKRPSHVIEIMKRTMFKKGQVAPNKGKHNLGITGEKSHFWKGGITPINDKIRKSLEYKLWREAVFKRDNWTCVWCRGRNGNGKTYYLHADHIQLFSTHPELRFAIDNGRTLCKECHYLRHTKK